MRACFPTASTKMCYPTLKGIDMGRYQVTLELLLQNLWRLQFTFNVLIVQSDDFKISIVLTNVSLLILIDCVCIHLLKPEGGRKITEVCSMMWVSVNITQAHRLSRMLLSLLSYAGLVWGLSKVYPSPETFSNKLILTQKFVCSSVFLSSPLRTSIPVTFWTQITCCTESQQ